MVGGEMRPGVDHLSETSWAVRLTRSELIGAPSIGGEDKCDFSEVME